VSSLHNVFGIRDSPHILPSLNQMDGAI